MEVDDFKNLHIDIVEVALASLNDEIAFNVYWKAKIEDFNDTEFCETHSTKIPLSVIDEKGISEWVIKHFKNLERNGRKNLGRSN